MAVPPEPLITTAHLSNRLSKSTHTRVFNDNDTGEFDTEAEKQLRLDASTKVRGALPNIPIEELIASNETVSEELRRITLDVAHAMCALRSPLVIKIDALGLMDLAEKDLLRLRNSQITLVTNPDDEDPDEDGEGGISASPFTVSSGTLRGWDTDDGV